jgi:hypothetical protein
VSAKLKKVDEDWVLVVHHAGRRTKRKLGSSLQDKREGEQLAKKINAMIALGQFNLKNPADRPLRCDEEELPDRAKSPMNSVGLPPSYLAGYAETPLVCLMHRGRSGCRCWRCCCRRLGRRPPASFHPGGCSASCGPRMVRKLCGVEI